MKREQGKSKLIEQLKKMPIVQIACERAGIGRSTYYRWREESADFRKAADAAITEGEALITDMSESQLISLIRDKHFQAVQLWLRQHHPKYSGKVEISGSVTVEDGSLTPEQEALIKEALRLAALPVSDDLSEQNHG